MSKIWRFELTSRNADSDELGLSHVHYQTDLGTGDSEPSANTVLGLILTHFSSSGHNMVKWANAMRNDVELTRAALRQEVDPNSDDIPEVAEELFNISGTLGTPGTDVLPGAMCVWHRFRTGSASRSSRGGTHAPGTTAATDLDTGGQWQSGTTHWTAQLALAASILAPVIDFGTFGSDLLPVVYSRTRRSRSLTPYTFQLTSVTPSVRPRWLRRRDRTSN